MEPTVGAVHARANRAGGLLPGGPMVRSARPTMGPSRNLHEGRRAPMTR